MRGEIVARNEVGILVREESQHWPDAADLAGPILDELGARGGLGASRLSTQAASGDGVVIQAGGAPERGDVNRRQVPPAYREVDALVRPLRAASGVDLPFFAPWDEGSIERWLRRFEVESGP